MLLVATQQGDACVGVGQGDADVGFVEGDCQGHGQWCVSSAVRAAAANSENWSAVLPPIPY